jgi:hypothetical protein
MVENAHETVRNGLERQEWSCKRTGTVCNDHTVQDKRPETFLKSRSRYVHVHVSKTKETLYFTLKYFT